MGVNIRDVIIPDGAAHAAGLKENDVIVEFDGVPVNTSSELQVQVGKHRPGDKATVTYLRNGKRNTTTILLKNVAGNTNVVTAKMMEGEAVYGARLAELSSSEKADLNINYGVKVTELNDGKFKDLGIKEGYVILSVNGNKVRTANDVRKYTDNESKLKSIEGIQSDGTVFSYTFGN